MCVCGGGGGGGGGHFDLPGYQCVLDKQAHALSSELVTAAKNPSG